MSNIPKFDVASAALEHLELLNHSNQNPLEIAAQFRTLLRTKKHNKNKHSSNNDDAFVNYITADTTIREKKCPHTLTDHPSKPLPELHASDSLSKHQDSGVSSHHSNRFHYPTINWKQLRKKQYEYKLEQFLSTKFKTKDLTNIPQIRNNLQKIICPTSQNRSSSPSIRTPSISPIPFPHGTYTISRFHSTSITSEDILFPIADCNLMIKHKPKKLFDLFCNNTEETVF